MEMACEKCGTGADLNYWRMEKIDDRQYEGECPECHAPHLFWQDRLGGTHVMLSRPVEDTQGEGGHETTDGARD